MICPPDTSHSATRAWLLPAEFTHLTHHTRLRYNSNALPYDQWAAAVQRSMPLVPACIKGPVEELPTRLCSAFEAACSNSPASHVTHYVAEKREVLYGLGLQILRLGMWNPPVPRTLGIHSGIEPINALNAEFAETTPLRAKNGLEGLDCIFFITSIFLTTSRIPTPYLPPESPTSWVPYTIEPLTTSVNRTSVPELAHRAMRFWDYPQHFTFSVRLPDPSSTTPAFSLEYWQSCAGLGTKGIPSLLSSLILKIVMCRQIYDAQV